MPECLFCSTPVREFGDDRWNNLRCSVREAATPGDPKAPWGPPVHIAAKPAQVFNGDLNLMLVATMRSALATRNAEHLDAALALLVRYSRLLPVPRQHQIGGEIYAVLSKYDRQWQADSAPLSAEELEQRERLGRTFFWRKVKRVRDSSYWLGDEQRHRQWAEFAATAVAADCSMFLL